MAAEMNGVDESMDVDLVEQQVLDELQTLRHTTPLLGIEQMDHESSFSPTLLASSNQAVVLRTNSLIFVIDTNVLLSNLSFLLELRMLAFPTISQILFLIPWVVLQELDYIKTSSASNPDLSKKARAAISFLHQEFSDSSKNVIGQTMDEDLAFIQKVPGTRYNNDDRILHCCLDQSKKWSGALVIMFTNDKNLMNKCQVNRTTVVDRRNVLPFLRNLSPVPTSVSYTHLPQNHNPHPPTPQPLSAPPAATSTSNPAQSPAKPNATYTEAFDYAITLARPLLIAFIEEKMRTIFGDIWLQICYVKPPWSMLDVLALLEKHWIAVFTDFSKFNASENALGLKMCLLDAERFGCREQHLSYCLDNLQVLIHTFSQHIPTCVEALSRLTGLQRDIPNFMTSPPSQGIMSPVETRTFLSMQIDPPTAQHPPPALAPPLPYPTPPASPTNSQSALDWALSTILEYIQGVFRDRQDVHCVGSTSHEVLILLQKFLLNMDLIASVIPNVPHQNIEGFTNSLNDLLSKSVRSHISVHVNTIGSLLSSAESAKNFKQEYSKFLSLYSNIYQN